MFNQKPSCCQESNKQGKKLADFTLWSNFDNKSMQAMFHGLDNEFIQAFIP